MSTEGAKPQKRWPAPICRSSRSSRLEAYGFSNSFPRGKSFFAWAISTGMVTRPHAKNDGPKGRSLSTARCEEREAAKETVSIHPDFAW